MAKQKSFVTPGGLGLKKSIAVCDYIRDVGPKLVKVDIDTGDQTVLVQYNDPNPDDQFGADCTVETIGDTIYMVTGSARTEGSCIASYNIRTGANSIVASGATAIRPVRSYVHNDTMYIIAEVDTGAANSDYHELYKLNTDSLTLELVFDFTLAGTFTQTFILEYKYTPNQVFNCYVGFNGLDYQAVDFNMSTLSASVRGTLLAARQSSFIDPTTNNMLAYDNKGERYSIMAPNGSIVEGPAEIPGGDINLEPPTNTYYGRFFSRRFQGELYEHVFTPSYSVSVICELSDLGETVFCYFIDDKWRIYSYGRNSDTFFYETCNLDGSNLVSTEIQVSNSQIGNSAGSTIVRGL